MENQRNELDCIEKYQARGYICNFKCEDNKLLELKSNKLYSPNEIIIKRTQRFEGLSNPSDMSILYVIETKDGIKGLVTANYGIESDTDLDEFFKKIPSGNDESNDAI
ncbi:hypothetical protein BZARG_740 [Bizionia argentinensis JUB59]|uniref:Phosphoribosylpyrophosphate synthetase n=1 Tax=Bizionia argentinensis JUB59 TaxID=1046627 RepID=G2EB57_9FLAO|nr:hypothetical protein [Bizionia argentinensis]EGV44268.1 hypothetical protein BZARG_740 [Bizionia argentinensis JUB59]